MTCVECGKEVGIPPYCPDCDGPRKPEAESSFATATLLAALVKSAEARRELLMSVRGKTYDGKDRDNLQWRSQAMDDLAEVVREVIKASNNQAHR